MLVQQEEILPLFRRLGAVIVDSHIVYTSGKHGSAYVNKDAIYPHTLETLCLCENIAEHFKTYDVQTVIAPAIGAVLLSQGIAHCLTQRKAHQVFAVYAEKSEGDCFVIKRGYDKFITDHNVLVVEDVLNTGGSARKVVDAVKSIHGNVMGVAALCNRGGVTAADLGDVPKLFSLVDVSMDAWEESECPLCQQGVPINTHVGKGREFLARFRDQRVGK